MKTILSLLLVPACLILLTGCLSPGSSPATTYYQLRPMDPAPEPIDTFEGIMVVGPVELSPYLNNPRLVIRPTPHRVEYLEFHRWAEPLEQNLANVIAGDLSELLQSDLTYAYTPRVGIRDDVHSIRMRVHGFEVNENGQATLDISAVHLKGMKLLRNPILHLKLKGPVEGASPEQQVAALNQLVHELSLALAREVMQDVREEKETP